MKKNKIDPLLSKLSRLLEQASNRSKLTVDEVQELRANLSSTKAVIVDKIFPMVSTKRMQTELYMDEIEGKEFSKYFKGYLTSNVTDNEGNPILDAKGNPKKYTASIAESFARKALHAKGTPYYKAKKAFLEAKKEEQKLYQLFKAVDQVTNSLSAITKAS